MKMKARNAIVTGSTKGIGRAIVEELATLGMNIILVARTENDLLNQQNELIKSHPDLNISYYSCDLAEKDEVKKLGNQIREDFDQIDVLVNNAGVFLPGLVTEEPEGQLESQIQSNLYSAYHLTRSLLDMIRGNETSYIFNICSVASIMAYPNGGSYSISKFALLGFTRALREELKATHVKVSAILPGATWSSSWTGVDLPENRLMKPEDIAKLISCAIGLSDSATIEDIVIRPQLGDL